MPCRVCGNPLFNEELKDELCFRHNPRRQPEGFSNYAGNVGSQVQFVKPNFAYAKIGKREYDAAGRPVRR